MGIEMNMGLMCRAALTVANALRKISVLLTLGLFSGASLPQFSNPQQ